MDKPCFSQVYSSTGRCDYPSGIPVTDDLIQNAVSILEERGSVYDKDNDGDRKYIFEGNVVEVNCDFDKTVDDGWTFKLHSEYEKGLEKLAEELCLPLPQKISKSGIGHLL